MEERPRIGLEATNKSDTMDMEGEFSQSGLFATRHIREATVAARRLDGEKLTICGEGKQSGGCKEANQHKQARIMWVA